MEQGAGRCITSARQIPTAAQFSDLLEKKSRRFRYWLEVDGQERLEGDTVRVWASGVLPHSTGIFRYEENEGVGEAVRVSSKVIVVGLSVLFVFSQIGCTTVPALPETEYVLVSTVQVQEKPYIGKVIGVLAFRERVTVLERKENGSWARVRSAQGDIAGWVESQDLSAIDVSANVVNDYEPDLEEMRVYAAALNIKGDSLGTLVFHDWTTITNRGWDPTWFVSEYPELAKAYNERNRAEFRFKKSLSFPSLGIRWYSEVVDEIRSAKGSASEVTGWDEILGVVPDCIAVVDVSAIAFNGSRDMALLFVRSICGDWCEMAMYVVLGKLDGEWQIRHTKVLGKA